MRDEQRDLEITRRVMTDKTKLGLMPSVGEAWLILSAIQFATRTPILSGPMATVMEKVGRKYQRAIVGLHPEADAILEAGWDPDQDR